jgi:hypothetical protein
MLRRKPEKPSKNGKTGRPSKEPVTLRCLEALGGRVRQRDLIRELEGAIVARVSESTVINHLDHLKRQGIPVIGGFKVAPIIVERLSDTCTGRFLKFVLRGRAEFLDCRYVYSIDHVTRFEIIVLFALFLQVALHDTPHLTALPFMDLLSNMNLSTIPHLVTVIIMNLSLFGKTFIAILTIMGSRKILGIISKRKQGISRYAKLTVEGPDGKKAERKFRADTKVMEVIKWAAAELYGDKDADVTEYILQHEGKELDRYAKLWEFDELWIRSGNDRSKRPYLVLVHRRKK